jgi:hypothetical protein
MKRETFNLGVTTLLNAFPSAVDRITNETLEIYWLDLKDIPDNKFISGITWCRHHLKFFPMISELGMSCFNGNENWAEEIVHQKRLAFDRQQKKLTPPMGEKKKLENQQKVSALARSFVKSIGEK